MRVWVMGVQIRIFEARAAKLEQPSLIGKPTQAGSPVDNVQVRF
jgi:hypothetical protein